MKQSARYKIELLMLLFIIIFSFFMFIPFVRILEKKISVMRDILIQEIETVYGLKISYESLSPSLFRAFSLRNITIYDTETGSELAVFETITVQYRFFALLSGKIPAVLHSLTIKNGFITIDMLQNEHLIAKFTDRMQQNSSKKPAPPDAQPTDIKAAVESIFSSAELEPFDILIQNVHLRFKDAMQEADVHITDGLCSVDSESLKFGINSAASYQNSNYAAYTPFKTTFNIDGKFEKNLTAGSCIVNIAQCTTPQVGLDTIKLFVGYRDSVISVNTMQDFQPLDASLKWNMDSKVLSGSFQCKEFLPLQWVKLYSTPKELEPFRDLEVSGGVHFSLQNEKLSWDTDTALVLPDITLANYRLNKTTLQFAAAGNDNVIDIAQLALKGNNIDLLSKLRFDLKKKIPSGTLAINSLQLPSGQKIAANIRFVERNGLLHCSIPMLRAGDAVIEDINFAVNPSSRKIDFLFSGEDGYGKYTFDGSCLLSDNPANPQPQFLELHAALDAVNIKNMYNLAQTIHPVEGINSEILEPLQCTTEFYISTDFKHFSYNCIKFVLVSNRIDDFYALLSVKGTEKSFSITDIDVAYKNMSVRGSLNAEFENLNDIIFDSSFVANEIGYQFQGFFAQNILNIYGDYGFAVSAIFDKETGVKGSIKAADMPLPLLPLFVGLDAEFDYAAPDLWGIHIYSGNMNYGGLTALAQTALRLSFTGSIDPAGLFLHKVRLGSDENSLDGTIIVQMPSPESLEQAYQGEIKLSSADDTEHFTASALVRLSESLYISGGLTAENIGLRRFLYTQGKKHSISAGMTFTVSPEGLKAECSIPELSFFLKGKDLQATTHFTVDNYLISLSQTEAAWGDHRIYDIGGSFSFEELKGLLHADYSGSIPTKELQAHIETVFTAHTGGEPALPPSTGTALSTAGAAQQHTTLSLKSLAARLPSLLDAFSLTTTISDWQFGSMQGKKPIPLSVIREKDITALYAGQEEEITGFILNDGVISLHIADTLPVHFNLDGSVKPELLDLSIRDLYADIKQVWNLTGLNHVLFYSGKLTGNMHIGGTIREPEFQGKLQGKNIKVNSPDYIPEIYGPVNLDILADGTILEVPYVILKGPSADLWARCTVEFTQWIPETVSIQCGTLREKLGIVRTDNLLFKADGLAGCNAEILITPNLIGVYGTASFDKGYFAFKFTEMDKFHAKYANKGNGPVFDMQLNLKLGKKAEFLWPSADIPILRTLIPTETPLSLTVDGASGTFFMKGNVKMRGGEIFYIKRNFYIREGYINFVDVGGNFEPLITMRAEIRDRDENGEPLRLILTAKDQPLSNFNPTLISDPPRSSAEIMQMIGQVVIGGTNKENVWQNLLVSSSDILAQIGIFKKSQTKIRNFLGLDAFSFRTLLLQNAIFGNLFNMNKETVLQTSNYFDNTSVYIGKYFGSAIYADALLHLSHYDPKSLQYDGTKRPVYKNILFQPEIGLEMATPFFLMRWSLAPTRPETLFVRDASVTFSWKYSY
ncbi:MAG: translocation/assembly module TamB domain-containing protein [Treponema sp.]